MPSDPDLIVENGNLYPHFAFYTMNRNTISLMELQEQAEAQAAQILKIALTKKFAYSSN